MKLFCYFVLRFTVPEGQYFPASSFEALAQYRISFLVLRDLLAPVAEVAQWHAAAFLAVVSIPETAIDEDDFTPTPENEIRLARKIFGMKAEAITRAMRYGSHNKFGLHPLALDAPHIF